MKTEKITAAVQDETFAKSLIDMESPEEVKKAFIGKTECVEKLMKRR